MHVTCVNYVVMRKMIWYTAWRRLVDAGDVLAAGLDLKFTLRGGLRGGQSRNAVTDPPRSPCRGGSKN
jgi:hypothetical protein